MEKILEIFDLDNVGIDGDYGRYEGFQINTDKQRISILLSNEPGCCEQFGHICSEDKFDDFIGAELFGISTTDTARNTKIIELTKKHEDEGHFMFVNLRTSRGVLQFVLYNSHNGYYGHSAKVISNQLSVDGCL